MIDVVAPDEDRLVRHLDWQRAMQEAVSRALNEHRGQGHSIAVLRDGNVVTLTPEHSTEVPNQERLDWVAEQRQRVDEFVDTYRVALRDCLNSLTERLTRRPCPRRIQTR